MFVSYMARDLVHIEVFGMVMMLVQMTLMCMKRPLLSVADVY